MPEVGLLKSHVQQRLAGGNADATERVARRDGAGQTGGPFPMPEPR
ncbi:hypothetical protein J2W68_001561 [Luteimonas terrae]|uniref:Uncharacterized protein n=1 Tax=Luteimonas terrae TaxID=1530191 RepID=A0ABU1XX63_9GAMM|nr:hypothetical protein [Luteimonas terrae]